LTAIAHGLGRSTSTISREVARNHGLRGYQAVQADRLGRGPHPGRPKPAKLAVDAVDAVPRAHVEQRLAQRWSPQQISARLVRDFPDDPRMRVSPRDDLHLAVRAGPRRAAQRRVLFSPQRIRDKVMISQRPVEVADRLVAGH
jgi:transposase, IS30 family